MPNARELTNRMASMLGNERNAMADFLVNLADFDAKKRWRELGHTSCFWYLRCEFKLSAGAAQARKTAAELIQRFPEIVGALRSGELCITTVNEVAKVLTAENHDDVLPRFFRLSRQDAAALAASLRPSEVIPLRDVVTPIQPAAPAPAPVPSRVEFPATSADRASPARLFRLGEMESTPALAPYFNEATDANRAPLAAPVPTPARDSVEPLDAQLSRLHVTVSRAFLEKLEAVRNARSHSTPGATFAELLEHGLDLALAAHAKRKGLVAMPRKEPRPSRTDAIPAHVKREAWLRAGGRCEWTLESGERCPCRRQLEYDHIRPLALGGTSMIDNIRVLCRAHNLLAARQVFGDEVMDRYAPGRPSLVPPR